MYLYGFDIGGTKCAVILAKVEGDQVDFLERYEMKTLGDWKKVLDELSENALMIAKKYGLTTGTEGENCVICGGISCGGPLSPDRKWILSPPNLQGWDQVPVVEYLEEKLGIPVKMENDADAGALAEWKFGAGKGCQNMIFLLAQVLVPVLSLMDSYTGEVPVWLGKQDTYVWKMRDQKDMEK